MKDTTQNVLQDYIFKYPFLSRVQNEVVDSFCAIDNCFSSGGKLLVCGNGGSAADADHIVGELMKNFIIPRKLSEDYITEFKRFGDIGMALTSSLQGSLPAINLSAHTSLLTAIINDIGSDNIFAQQVLGYGTTNDVLLGISTSGNSRNVIFAGMTAKVKNMITIGLTGEKSGRMHEIFDIVIKVPSVITDEIQNMHSAVYHLLCAMLENERWGYQI